MIPSLILASALALIPTNVLAANNGLAITPVIYHLSHKIIS
jgi:hypothetical protein